MYARSAKLSDKVKRKYLGFWQLDEFPYEGESEIVDVPTAKHEGFYYPQSPKKEEKEGHE